VSIVDVRPPQQLPRGPRHAVGTKVTVRNRYLGTWCEGFEVVSLEAHGYRIKRDSDGALITQLIAIDDVREAFDVREPFDMSEPVHDLSERQTSAAAAADDTGAAIAG